MTSRRRIVLALLALSIAAAVWLSCVRILYPVDPADVAVSGVSPIARGMTNRLIRLWTDPALRQTQIERMRGSNAEWDFMARTFGVLALANIALAEPERKETCLEIIDTILEETLRIDRERDIYFFLMDYARTGDWVDPSARSVFVDGEIALMLGARQLVEVRADYREPLAGRVDRIVAQMGRGPILSAESYPDECWVFCNAVALAAIRISDVLDGRDQGVFIREWIDAAREYLVDDGTGLLVSRYDLAGRVMEGPEGSSIWMAAHCLALVDPAFARDQYDRAKRDLGGELFGFGYAREWPASWRGEADVDSGPVVPVLGVSAGSSGLAFVAAREFGDSAYLRGLMRSLRFGGFPVRDGESLRFSASNSVGDAVLLYGLVHGPLWEAARARWEGTR